MTRELRRKEKVWIACILCAAVVGILVLTNVLRDSLVPDDDQNPEMDPSSANVGREGGRQAVSANEAAVELGQPDTHDYELEDQLAAEILEESEAVRRWVFDPGPKRLEDAEIMWQRRADEYVQFLRQETFDQGLYRTYTSTELLSVLGNYPNIDPDNPDTIRVHARTRRFCKLAGEINRAKQSGNLAPVIESITNTIDRLIAERKQLEEKILRLIEEEPQMFGPKAPTKDIVRLQDLLGGFATTCYLTAEEVIPMSFRGTQLGILANSCLLGLTEDPRALEPLLRLAGYDSRACLDKLEHICGDFLLEDLSLVNKWAVADAVDRILVSIAGAQSNSAAGAIGADYVKWRSQRNWPAREIIQILPYDARQTPYDLPGYMTGRVSDIETTPLALPIPVSENGRPGLIQDDVETILQWAARLRAAL
jgi:hypothetical protein